jgi:8-oxo-dGTP pyrophosphatase MutT (NUDIX family)
MPDVPDLPIGFMSYAHIPSQPEQLRLDGFREKLETEVHLQTGDPFRIFQDRRDIQWGEAWQRRIETSIDSAALLIPILTPAFFKSRNCKAELERFLQRERELECDDLIRPVYYITCPVIEGNESEQDDPLVKIIKERQYVDCRRIRFSAPESAYSTRRVAELGGMIAQSIQTSRAASKNGAAEAKVKIGGKQDYPVPSGISISRVDLPSAAGLVGVFESWPQCQDEVLRELTESQSIKVFAQIGKSVLSGAAVIFNALEHLGPDSRVQILHAGVTNPYVSESSALRRGADYREWREDIEYVRTHGDRLRARLGSRLEIREHLEGYLWRLFIFDDLAYLQPYSHRSDNAQKAPVFKFSRLSGPTGGSVDLDSLYHMFAQFFDLKWEECAASPVNLHNMIDVDQRASVVALAQDSGRRLFVIPTRLLERNGRELEFHYIGGKRGRDESWIDALQREAREEIGTELIVRSSTITRDLTTDAEFEPLHLSDNPRPYFVYKRTRENPREAPDADILWVVGYEARIPSGALIEPCQEIAAVVSLSADLLRRCAREIITYRQIADATDGSSIVVHSGVSFDYGRIAKPAHLASLSVKVW